MPTYRGYIATDKVNANGDQFTKEALEQLAKQAEGVPVTFNFGHHVIARSGKGSLTEKGVEVTVNINRELPVYDLYLVPGIVFEEGHRENRVLIIEKFMITELSLVQNPADNNLLPIHIVKPDKGETK